ncbi:MAG: hypothetical protein CMQ14_03050 [Gammaproteobacteria bacterium]|nr:hypothetical protein [Gammaproteobacteria bacterium]
MSERRWQRFLILSHRYLGIALCLLFCLWFASGFVIIYTGGMPQLSEAERLARLPVLNLSAVELSPQAARAALRRTDFPTLTTRLGRPAYVFTGNTVQVLFADNGELLTSSMISSRQIAADFLSAPPDALDRVGLIESVDQWTLGLRSELPLQKYRSDDGQGSEVYVSPSRGRVVLYTTSRDRLLAWLGAIPHWLYFLPLRADTTLWSATVIGLASVGVIFVALGLVLMFTQLRWRHWPNLLRAIPYHGLMKWHYMLGIGFGWCVLTWVFSGLLSMEPYSWNRASGMSFDAVAYFRSRAGVSVFESEAPAADLAVIEGSLKEVNFHVFAGKRFYELSIGGDSSIGAISREFREVTSMEPLGLFTDAQILAQLEPAVAANMVAAEILNEYDNYYYGRNSRRQMAPPLPVLRVEFDDLAGSRYYLSLQTGELEFVSHRANRTERWLYRGLHSLDFNFLYPYRPAWDVVVWLLLAGGLLLSLLGAYLGLSRVGRWLEPR